MMIKHVQMGPLKFGATLFVKPTGKNVEQGLHLMADLERALPKISSQAHPGAISLALSPKHDIISIVVRNGGNTESNQDVHEVMARFARHKLKKPAILNLAISDEFTALNRAERLHENLLDPQENYLEKGEIEFNPFKCSSENR
ncbi:MAG TPA: hypothetical protein V6C52_10380 [Coleofasciculaceae cyanobacterium]|jgi:hypothetical protein